MCPVCAFAGRVCGQVPNLGACGAGIFFPFRQVLNVVKLPGMVWDILVSHFFATASVHAFTLTCHQVPQKLETAANMLLSETCLKRDQPASLGI